MTPKIPGLVYAPQSPMTPILENITRIAASRANVLVTGESGSGKSSLARAILRLEKSQGTIKFHGQEIQDKKNHEIRPIRREMQIVFQDPFSSLSPRLSIKQIIESIFR